MRSFICKVMTPQGQVIKIKLTEEDKIACLKKLKRNGMTPIEIKPSLRVPPNVSRKISSSIAAKKKEKQTIKLSKEVIKRIKIDDIREFTEQLLFLKEANFSNTSALKIIIKNTRNESFSNILKAILKNCEKNIYIYRTMESYNQIFPSIYINLIKNGELTEALDKGLKNAIEYLKKEEEITNIVQEKLFPNILLIFGTMLIMFLSIILGIPLIEELLFTTNITLELPLITRIVFEICSLITYKWYIFLVLIGILISLIILKLKVPEGRLKFDKFKYKNKIFGKALYLVDFCRLIRSLVINFENKMRLQDCLEVGKDVVKNTWMLNTIEKSINSIFKGNLWIDAFEEDKILDPIVIETIKKSAETKKPELILKTIEYLENQIDRELEKLVMRLTEISYIILGVLFLIYIGTILLPCISVYLSSFLLF